jgi:hypothetical protein
MRHRGVVHPQSAAFILVRHGLDHRPEDVGFDLGPVQIADMREIALRDAAELWHVGAAREQLAVHIRENIRPTWQLDRCTILDRRVHATEEFADDLVGVGPVGVGHLFDGRGEQVLSVQDVGVFGEEQKDQPRHEVVHVGASLWRSPFGIVGPQRRVELVQTLGGQHIELGPLCCLVLLSPARGQKKKKWLGKSA